MGIFTILANTLPDNMPARRKYNKVSNSDRKRIYDCFKEGRDWRQLAKTLGINQRTAQHWLFNDQVEPKKKGGSLSKKTPEIMNFFTDVIEEKTSITLKELKDLLLQHFRMNVSINCIKNWLDGELFSVKDVRPTVLNMNSVENKAKRARYIEGLFNARSEGRTIIWIDESNFNLYCKRKQGRSKIGSRASIIQPTCKGQNLHCIGAMSSNQMIHFSTHRGSYTRNECLDWFRELVSKCEEQGMDRLTLIIDNAPVHSNLEEIEEEYNDVQILRLAPYSYLLNPIELLWSEFKSHVKRMLRDQMFALNRIESVQGGTIADQRMQALEEVAENAIQQVPSSHLMAFANRVERYYSAAARQDDIVELP